MKKIKKNSNNKKQNVCKCAVCGRNAGEDIIRSPFGTVVCLECAHALHQIIDQASKGGIRNALFAQKIPSEGECGITPVFPLFAE